MKKIILMLVLVMAVSGCATPIFMDLKKRELHYTPSGDPNKGLIYVYRDDEFFGCARGIYVTGNDVLIGGLNSGTYFVYEADPGKIIISVQNWLGDDPSRTIDVKPGQKYYLKGSLKFGFWEPSPYIEIMYEQEGEAAIRSLTYATLK